MHCIAEELRNSVYYPLLWYTGSANFESFNGSCIYRSKASGRMCKGIRSAASVGPVRARASFKHRGCSLEQVEVTCLSLQCKLQASCMPHLQLEAPICQRSLPMQNSMHPESSVHATGCSDSQPHCSHTWWGRYLVHGALTSVCERVTRTMMP